MAPPKGWKPTAEQRKRMGDSHRGFKHTPETCRKYSESKKGAKNPMYGTHLSDERKKQVSERHKGKVVSEETRKRMSAAQKINTKAHLGHKRTQETKDKISKARKGIMFSEEHLKNLSISHKGQIVTEEGRRKRSEYNKSHPEVTNRLRKIRCARPSKPQLMLLEIIKSLYPNETVEHEYRVETPIGHRDIDVAVPNLMLGFEYDEPAYHGLYWGSKEKDAERHQLLESLGWRITHYSNISEFPKK